jgi:hypothetical protein
LIQGKQAHLIHLREDVFLQKKIKNWAVVTKSYFYNFFFSEFQNKIEKEICFDLPNAFWKRKQHIVDLPYDDSFNEK